MSIFGPSGRKDRRRAAALLLATVLGVSVPGEAAKAQYFSLGKGSPLEFYDFDYSYLADPAKRTDPLDYLHYIALGPDLYLSWRRIPRASLVAKQRSLRFAAAHAKYI